MTVVTITTIGAIPVIEKFEYATQARTFLLLNDFLPVNPYLYNHKHFRSVATIEVFNVSSYCDVTDSFDCHLSDV
jgi:hypothetical protein